jgi:hypothetical protein
MKKGLIIAAAMILAVCLGIGGTLAYLFVTSNTVTNTFAYGDINIELKENKLVNGELTTEEVEANENYKVIPGVTEKKNPFVRIKANSVDCYVYVTVENNLVIGSNVVGILNIDTTKWIWVATKGNKTLYRYVDTVKSSAADQTLPVFTTVTYDSTKITKTNIKDLANKTVTVVAYAYQTANVSIDAANTEVKTLAGMN